MKKVFIGLLLALSVVLGTQSVFAHENTGNNIVYSEKSDYFERFVLYNEGNKKNFKVDSNERDFLEEYNINMNQYQKSEETHVQREIVEVGGKLIKASEGYGFNDEGLLGVKDNHTYKEDSYLQSKGYVTFTIKAYKAGIYYGNVVYLIEVDVDFNKGFFNDLLKDNLIIQRGDNASGYDGIEIEGQIKKKIYYQFGDSNILPDTETLKIDAKNKGDVGAGVRYEFRTKLETTNTIEYGQVNKFVERISGNYYMIATGTTEVLPTYIHNYNSLKPSLDITFGSISAGISSGIATDQMHGKNMTLPGTNDRITKDVKLSLTPEELLFEAQYFFYEKESTHNIDGMNFKTKRLRTGYIEEEYINLSPNRDGAGKAYLEFNFEKTIHVIRVDLAFWSAYEKYIIFDTAKIQYKNSNGQWITLLDILDSKNNVPSNRKTPKTFDLEIILGTTDIRFYSEVLNPTGIRNLGRISIGNLLFEGYAEV